MKAVVWRGGQTFGLEDVPEPRPAAGQVKVKVAAAAICGSDFHLADFRTVPPVIPGHEAAGTVVEIAPDVAGVSIGQRVALDPVQRCGRCWCCRNGMGHLCPDCRHLGGGQTPGAWAEYVAIDVANAYPVADGVDLTAACLLEPAAVCYESFQRAGLRRGDRVLVIGDGPFGFLHAQLARAMGAATVVVAGHHRRRLERIAAVTGAAVCDTHHEDLGDLLARQVGLPGVDVAIEATGAGGSPNIGLKALRPRGTLVIFSYIWKPEVLDLALIHMRELNVLGSCRSLAACAPCLEMMADGRLDLKALVDVQTPLADHQAAMAALVSRKAEVFKAVLRP